MLLGDTGSSVSSLKFDFFNSDILGVGAGPSGQISHIRGDLTVRDCKISSIDIDCFNSFGDSDVSVRNSWIGVSGGFRPFYHNGNSGLIEISDVNFEVDSSANLVNVNSGANIVATNCLANTDSGGFLAGDTDSVIRVHSCRKLDGSRINVTSPTPHIRLNGADDLSYDNSTSGLTSEDVQNAIDEVAALITTPGSHTHSISEVTDLEDRIIDTPASSAPTNKLIGVSGGQYTPFWTVRTSVRVEGSTDNDSVVTETGVRDAMTNLIPFIEQATQPSFPAGCKLMLWRDTNNEQQWLISKDSASTIKLVELD